MDEKFMELASEQEQMQRDYAAKAAAMQNKPESHPDFDGKHCVRCDEAIPEGRLTMGKVYCTNCQSLRERLSVRR